MEVRMQSVETTYNCSLQSSLLPLVLPLTMNCLLFFSSVLEAMQVYVPGSSDEEVRTASSSNVSCIGWEDCQLYMGLGFPVAVQFKEISPPALRSKTSGSGLRNIGGTREEIVEIRYTITLQCIKRKRFLFKTGNSIVTHSTQRH